MASDTRVPIVTPASDAASSWGLGDGQAIPWEYAPAPESRDIVTITRALRPVHRRPRRRRPRTAGPSRASIRRPRSRSPRSPGRPRRTSTRPSAPRGAPQKPRWGDAARQGAGQVPVPDRPDPPGAQPRVRRPRIDGLGQADQGEPRRRRAARGGPLLVLRRLGRQARLRVPGPRRPAARRRRPDHPVELPAADAGLEDRAGPRRRATPSSSSPPRRRRCRALLFAEVCRQADLPPGVVNIVPGPGEVGMALVTHPGVDKVAFTGSTEIGQADLPRRRRARTRR